MWKALEGLPVWALVLLGLVALLSSGGGLKVTLDFARWLIEHRAARRNPRPKLGIVESLRCRHELHDEMNRILAAVGADQVILLCTHNGGGIPTAGSRVRSSVITEVYSARAVSVKDRWVNQELDQEYTRLILDVIEQGMVRNVVSEMPPSKLRDVYVNNSVYKSRVYPLRTEKLVFYYVSITWLEKPPMTREEISDELRVGVGALRQILAQRPYAEVEV